MKDCIFCKIAKGESKSAKIWEDKEFVAFLNLYPNTKGAAIVVSKKHYSSYAFNLPKNIYVKAMIATMKVAKLLDKKLKVKRTAMVLEGTAIDHLHLKLYPLYGLKKEFEPMIDKERPIFFKKYLAYVTTINGPKADMKKLKKLATKIRR
jgi:diadenosine tetraphosphate (Ap4A) HIT family hydrolase